MIGYLCLGLGERLTSFQYFYASRNVIKTGHLPTFVMDLRESRKSTSEEELLHKQAQLQEYSSVVKSDQLIP